MITTLPETHIRYAAGEGGEPLVSAVMIFLNAERFIEEAIQSVFGQSYREWELILVDDGTTDNSTLIAKSYANKYSEKVRYVEHAGHENRGMSASRNLGLMHARGQYVAFLDADDVWLPDKLGQQVEILNSHPDAAMVYGATQYWYSWTGDADDARRDYVIHPDVKPDTLVSPPALVSALLRNQVAASTGCLARREIIQQVGGYEESFRGMFEDQVFHSKISLRASVFVSSQCWYRYRKHGASCCAVAERSGEHRTQRLTFLDWLERYSSEQGISDTVLRRAIRRERWKSRHPVLSGLRDHLAYRARIAKDRLKSIARSVLPAPVYCWARRRRYGADGRIPVGVVRFGDLRRLTPVSRVYGFDRGTPVDRYFIEAFLARNAGDIRGCVLEVGDDTYTRRFGGGRVTRSDVLHVSGENSRATIVADLTNADHIPSDTFDCIVLTQTLHLIYDVRAALRTLKRILRPGGVLLATFPGISQIDQGEWGPSWYWSFTALSARRFFEEVFPSTSLSVEAHGNVLAATAFLHGIAVEELQSNELDHNDPSYQVTIAVRATKEVLR